jgi:hypothetical protein
MSDLFFRPPINLRKLNNGIRFFYLRLERLQNMPGGEFVHGYFAFNRPMEG